MPFEGRTSMGYNNLTKKYQKHRIDNISSGMILMEGTYDEPSKTLTLTGRETDPMTGKENPVRETLKFIDDKNQYMEKFETKGGKESKTIEIRFTKK